MANRADGVIVCSRYMRGHVADALGIDRDAVAVVPNGIDRAEATPVLDLHALRARLASPQERLVLLLGRLVYEKGFQIALEALPRLIESAGSVRFVMAGSGTHERHLREQASALDLDRHGEFLGWVDDDVLHALYRVCDLAVVPSIYEPFGLVALEAMAAGCPCLVADTGGLREVVPHERAGLRFAAGDPVALAHEAARMLSDGALRERLIAEATAHARGFDWHDVAQRTAALYEQLSAAPAVRLA